MNNIFRVQILIFFFLGISFFLIFEPKMHPDSQGYIDYHSMRSVGYPFIIFLLKKNIYYVFLSQIIFSIISSFFFLKILRKIFSMNNLSFIFISSVLIIIALNISTNILSGSYAFSLYLIFLSLCFKSVDEEKTSYLLLSLIPAFLSLLVRPQLVFLIPSFFIFLLFIFYKTKEKKVMLALPISFLLFFLPPKINNFFNEKLNNINVPMTDTWNQLMILPLFIANNTLENNYSDTEMRNLFRSSYDCITLKGLTKEKTIQVGENWLYKLESKSFPIKNCVNVSIDNIFLELSQTKKEKISEKFFFASIQAHFENDSQNLIKGYFQKFSSGFGNEYYLGIFTIFLFSVLIYLLIFKSPVSLIFFSLLVSHYSNLFIIALGAPMLTRYKFYTEIVLILIIFSIVINYLNPAKNDR